MRLSSRLCRLELNARQSIGGCCAVAMRDGESFDSACIRLGVAAGAYIAVYEVLPPEQWCCIAKAQQEALTRNS